jgi:hypothetical protein
MCYDGRMFGMGFGAGRLAGMATHGHHGSPSKQTKANRKDFLVIAGILAFAAIVSHSGYSVPFVVGAFVFALAGMGRLAPKAPGQPPQSPVVRDLDAAAKRGRNLLKGG